MGSIAIQQVAVPPLVTLLLIGVRTPAALIVNDVDRAGARRVGKACGFAKGLCDNQMLIFVEGKTKKGRQCWPRRLRYDGHAGVSISVDRKDVDRVGPLDRHEHPGAVRREANLRGRAGKAGGFKLSQ